MKERTKNIPAPTFFGTNLKYLRRLQGHTQTSLATNVGLSRNNIASYESGVVEPNATNFLKICRFLNVDPLSMLQKNLVEESIIAMDESDKTADKPLNLFADHVDKLSQSTHEMNKIVDGFKAFSTIQNEEGEDNNDLKSILSNVLLLFDQLTNANWEAIQSMTVNEESNDSTSQD